ncbi:MAG: efflux RND transporter permease subunit [bacterium]|nr:efflux RND transporter permease subunit [bacterium]
MFVADPSYRTRLVNCSLATIPVDLVSAQDGLYYYPLARTVIGGLTASTFLTLVILPYIYVLFDNLSFWASKVWQASEPAVAAVANPVDTS